MDYPNLEQEIQLWKQGYNVIGIDEVGRGPLAGPVVAAAIYVDKGIDLLKDVKDSKQLSFVKRKEIYSLIKDNPKIQWGIGRVSERVIDRINILNATKLAMKRAVNNLRKRVGESNHFLILDGNFSINVDLPQKSIVKADQTIFSCALASIVAKVYRDNIMLRHHRKYPQYGFDRHKGYGTKYHIEMIKRHSPLVIHRKTFNPVGKMIKYRKIWK